MARARNPNRNKAFEIYKQHDGKIDLVEIASQLNIPLGTICGIEKKTIKGYEVPINEYTINAYKVLAEVSNRVQKINFKSKENGNDRTKRK